MRKLQGPAFPSATSAWSFSPPLLFLGIWLKLWNWGRPGWPDQPWVLALPYWIMASLFVAATFIDFEWFMIPDLITIGGIVLGVLLSFAIPTMQDQESNLMSGIWSLAGAGVGFAALWLVVRLGKVFFGKKRLKFTKAAAIHLGAPRSGGGFYRRRG